MWNVNDFKRTSYNVDSDWNAIERSVIEGFIWDYATTWALPVTDLNIWDMAVVKSPLGIYLWDWDSWELSTTFTFDQALNTTSSPSFVNLNWKPTITTTETSSKWWLNICIDNAVGDVARTTSWQLENNEALWIRIWVTASWASAEADSAVKRTWRLTFKLSTTDITWRIAWFIWNNASSQAIIPCKPSTKYKLSCWVKTTTAVTNWVFVKLETYNGTSFLVASESNKLTWTNDWTLCTVTATSGSTANFMQIVMMNNTAWNISDAWFDVNSMTFDEIIETTNDNLTTKEQWVVWFTAIGSTDNIDQSQLTKNDARNFWGDWSSSTYPTKIAMQIIPTKSKFTWVVLQRIADNWTFTWTVTISIQWDTWSAPDWVIKASYTYTNVQWEALTVDTDFTVVLPCILTIWSNYYVVIESSTTDATNNARLRATSASTNYAWIFKGYYSSAWSTVNYDLYFKTLYYKPTTSFNASLNWDSLSLKADEDWFLNGSKVDLVNWVVNYTETFWTQYLQNYTISWSDLICKINCPTNILSGIFTSDKVLTYSLDNITYWVWVPTGRKTIYVKIASYSWFASFSFKLNIDTSSIKTLYNFPTNKSILQTYTKQLQTATTTATYRATKYGFPAIEYAEGIYQFLEVNCEDSASTVKLSADWVTYTTKADWASLTISSTLLPVIYTDITITKNRLLSSSNDYNSSSDKDWSLQQGIVSMYKYQGISYDIRDIKKEISNIKQLTTPWFTIFTAPDITTEADTFLVVPIATWNINLLKVPSAWKKFSIIVKTSWTSSYTLTFATWFKTTGTLATGTSDAKYFTLNFVSDWIQAIELSRTTAM